MSAPDDKPLISICLIAYRQERFVRQAIRGIFAQTYSPLEVLLSDDCSPDGTFRAIQEEAAAYRGPHRVVVNRNEVNLGLSGHINRVVELSRGDLIVIAAGDDVSLPERVEWLSRAWLQAPEKIMVVQSGFVVVDEADNALGVVRKAPPGREIIRVAGREKLEDYVSTLRLATSGATFAYNRKVFGAFGPLPKGLFHEDNAILLRALLTGEMWMVGVPLIHRRAHGGNMMIQKSGRRLSKADIDDAERRSCASARHRITLYQAFRADIAEAARRGVITAAELKQLHCVCDEQVRRYSLENEFVSGSLFQKLECIRQMRDAGMPPAALRHWRTRLLPWPMLRTFKQIVAPFRPPTTDSILRGGEDFGLWEER